MSKLIILYKLTVGLFRLFIVIPFAILVAAIIQPTRAKAMMVDYYQMLVRLKNKIRKLSTDRNFIA